MLQAFGVSDKGWGRATNEDCFIVDETRHLCVVADGMGGHNAGEVAARIAADAIADFISAARPEGATPSTLHPFGLDPALSASGNLLRTAILLANIQILETAGASDEYAGMGTTIVAALVEGNRLSVGHVGDSRLYLLARGRLRQLTDDDSWVASVLAQDPDVDPVVLEHHPLRHALTNVIGGRAGTTVHMTEHELAGGDILLLSTDGVHSVVTDGQLGKLLLDEPDLARAAKGVVNAAVSRGSRDNCTAVVARYLSD